MKRNKGFTLFELIVTLAVLAVIAAMAAPSFGSLIAKQKINLAAKDLALTFGTVRAQATTLRKDIVIKFKCDTLPSTPCENTATTYYWLSPNNDIAFTREKLDVTFTSTGLAKQREKLIDNPNFDSSKAEDPKTNPKKITQIVPLEFDLCNANIKMKKTIYVSKVGTVDRITTGVC